MVVVRYIGYLSMLVGMRERRVQAEKPVSIKSIAGLPDNVDWNRIVVLINGKPGDPDALVSGDDVVSLLPFTGGG